MKKKFLFLILFIPLINIGQNVKGFKSSLGDSLHYTTYGQGKKVIILYGGPGYGTNGIQNGWSAQLKQKCEVIFFDQRGTGLSKNVTVDSTTINLDRAVKDVEDLRIALNEEKLVMVGYSWGAGLAMAYASRYPDKVENMVLVSPIGPDMSYAMTMADILKGKRYPNEKDSLKYWQNEEVRKKDPVMADMMATYYTYIPYFYDHEKGREKMMYLIKNTDYNPLMFSIMVKDLFKNYDVKEKLKQFTGKCTIIRADEDVIDYRVVCEISDILPQADVKNVSQSGHFIDLESTTVFFPYLRKALGLKAF